MPKIFAYCERGANPAFWAEPLNAVTNLAFIAAGLVALVLLARRPAGEPRGFRLYLAGLVVVIGVGSFLFHTLATPAAAIADTAPIGLFMLSYLAFALNSYARVPVAANLLLLGGFAGCIALAANLRCYGGEIGLSVAVPAFTGAACLRGGVTYVPALLAMLGLGGWLAVRRHPAAPYLLAAAMLFAASLFFRTMDRAWCGQFTLGSYRAGTHFLWHLLNGATLFALMLAAINHGFAARRAVADSRAGTR